MYIYVTTLFRQHGIRGERGYFYILDWSAKTIIKKINDISLRGVTRYNGDVVVIDFYNKIKRLNIDTLELELIAEYSEIKYPHLIYSHNNQLLITNTKKDSVGIVDSDYKWVKEIRLPRGDGGGGKLHLNSIGFDFNGDKYYMYNKYGELVNSNGEKIVHGLSHPHDIEFFQLHHCLISNSFGREVMVVDVKNKTRKSIAKLPKQPGLPQNEANFTRGISISQNKKTAIFGAAPAILHQINLESFNIIDEWRLSEDPEESIFDIFIDN